MKTAYHQETVTGEEQAKQVAMRLIVRSIWFEVEPWFDKEYVFMVKKCDDFILIDAISFAEVV